MTCPCQTCRLGVMLNWLKSLVREEAPEVVVDVDLGVETYHRMLKRYPRENVCDVNDELMREEFFEYK